MIKNTTSVHSEKNAASQQRLFKLNGLKLKYLLLLILFASLVSLLSGCGGQYNTRVPDPYRELSFPVDHKGHDNGKIEWWYYNGKLVTESGKTYHYFWSFFNLYLEDDYVLGIPINLFTWAAPFYTKPFHCGGFSILDVQKNKHYKEHSWVIPFFWRGKCSAADFNIQMGSAKSWRQPDDTFKVQAKIDGFDLDLTLTPTRGPVLYGNQKNGNLVFPPTVHRYYSFTRMKTEGTLKKGRHKEKVTGTSWFDHEWGFIYHRDFQGWHWMGINLDNGVDMTCGLVHYYSGEIVPQSFVTIRFPDGRTDHLEAKDFKMTPTRKWVSPKSSIVYSPEWDIEVPKYNIKLHAKAVTDSQEITIFPFQFWEGPCDVQGVFEGKSVTGRSFLEDFGNAKNIFRAFYRSEVDPSKAGRIE